MAYLKLVGSLTVFTTAFSLAGFAGAVDAGGNTWVGMLSSGAVGIFFGLLFGGAIRGRLLDVLYPPGWEPPDGLTFRRRSLNVGMPRWDPSI